MPIPCVGAARSLRPGDPGIPIGDRPAARQPQRLVRATSASDRIASVLREEVAVNAEQRLTLRLGQTRIGLDRPLGVDVAGFVRRRFR